MWELKQNEKNQEELDAYPRAMKFTAAADAAQKKKTISLESVVWRMVFKREPTCYIVDGVESQSCSQGRKRSVEDIYSVAKYYVKKGVTRKAVEEMVDKLIASKLLHQSFCLTVLRRVHTPAKAEVLLKDVKNALKL